MSVAGMVFVKRSGSNKTIDFPSIKQRELIVLPEQADVAGLLTAARDELGIGQQLRAGFCGLGRDARQAFLPCAAADLVKGRVDGHEDHS